MHMTADVGAAGLTNIKSEEGFLSKVSVLRAIHHLEAAELCIWWEVIVVKDLHSDLSYLSQCNSCIYQVQQCSLSE